MKLETTFAAVIALLTLSTTAQAISCYACPSTVFPFLCYPVVCQDGVTSCFTQSWMKDGLNYRQQGCFPPASLTCNEVSNVFCEPENALHCCNGHLCNDIDPLLNWAPKTPTNLVPVVGENSVELSWDPLCLGRYQFEISYERLIGGTTTGQQVTNLTTNSNNIIVYSLQPGVEYLFTVRSLLNGVYSLSSTIAISTLTTTPTNGGNEEITAKCWSSRNFIGSPSTLITCPNSDDFCYSRVEYLANTSETLTSRGCISKGDCEKAKSKNTEYCKPGESGSYCHFCCRGPFCNSVDWTNAGLTCDAIPHEERILCGWRGINIADCIQRGCCYLPSNDTVAWCHYGKYPVSTDPPPATSGLELWHIILIVAIIVVILIVIGIVVCCCMKRCRKRAQGFYDVYAVPKRREEREQRVNTVAREAYDNTVVEI